MNLSHFSFHISSSGKTKSIEALELIKNMMNVKLLLLKTESPLFILYLTFLS